MRRKLFRLVVSVLVAAAVVIPILWACAPGGPSLAFTWKVHPDLPLNGFARGNLGIIQPTYARSYLVVAYRYMTGSALTRTEQRGALELWDHRLHGGVLLPPAPKATQQAGPPETLGWIEAKAKFTREPVAKPVQFRWDGDFYRYQVSDSATAVAVATLQDRMKRWKRSQVLEWIRVQDAVFAIDEKSKSIPASALPGQDPLFQKDRAYQIACARFYAEEFEASRAAFNAITQDPASPWRRLSAYLVGRCWLTEGEVAKDSVVKRRCFLEAHSIFKGLQEKGLPSSPTTSVPEPIGEPELIEAIRVGEQRTLALSDPETAARAMVIELLKHGSSRDYGDLLGRYTNLMDANITGESDFWEDLHKPRAIKTGLLKDGLTEWVYRFQETGPRAYTLAYRRWKERRSLPWLLMALANGEPSSKGIQDVLEAGAAVPTGDPGYESVAFHRARILAAGDRRDEARAIIAPFLDGDSQNTSPSSLNLWRALRMPLATDYDTFLADALRIPAGVYIYGSEDKLSLTTSSSGTQATHPEIKKMLKELQSPPQFIQGDAAKVLNQRVPTEVLLLLAQRPSLPSHIRREWVRAAWVRAVLLERWDLAAEATPDLLDLEPELKPSLEGFVQASPEERPRLALMTLLRHPGLRWMVFQGINHRTFTEPSRKPLPLHQRDEYLGSCWWPGPERTRQQESEEDMDMYYVWGDSFYYPRPNILEHPLYALAGGKSPKLSWLTPEQREQGESEGKRLLSLEDGPDWLAERALAWALAAPEDPRVPEALHYAVRAGKVGGEKRFGSKCFRLLHTRYKPNPWASKTPIYY